MKLLNTMLIAVGASAAICIGYFATLTAILVKIHNEGIEEGEEV